MQSRPAFLLFLVSYCSYSRAVSARCPTVLVVAPDAPSEFLTFSGIYDYINPLFGGISLHSRESDATLNWTVATSTWKLTSSNVRAELRTDEAVLPGGFAVWQEVGSRRRFGLRSTSACDWICPLEARTLSSTSIFYAQPTPFGDMPLFASSVAFLLWDSVLNRWKFTGEMDSLPLVPMAKERAFPAELDTASFQLRFSCEYLPALQVPFGAIVAVPQVQLFAGRPLYKIPAITQALDLFWDTGSGAWVVGPPGRPEVVLSRVTSWIPALDVVSGGKLLSFAKRFESSQHFGIQQTTFPRVDCSCDVLFALDGTVSTSDWNSSVSFVQNYAAALSSIRASAFVGVVSFSANNCSVVADFGIATNLNSSSFQGIHLSGNNGTAGKVAAAINLATDIFVNQNASTACKFVMAISGASSSASNFDAVAASISRAVSTSVAAQVIAIPGNSGLAQVLTPLSVRAFQAYRYLASFDALAALANSLPSRCNCSCDFAFVIGPPASSQDWKLALAFLVQAVTGLRPLLGDPGARISIITYSASATVAAELTSNYDDLIAAATSVSEPLAGTPNPVQAVRLADTLLDAGGGKCRLPYLITATGESLQLGSAWKAFTYSAIDSALTEVLGKCSGATVPVATCPDVQPCDCGGCPCDFAIVVDSTTGLETSDQYFVAKFAQQLISWSSPAQVQVAFVSGSTATSLRTDATLATGFWNAQAATVPLIDVAATAVRSLDRSIRSCKRVIWVLLRTRNTTEVQQIRDATRSVNVTFVGIGVTGQDGLSYNLSWIDELVNTGREVVQNCSGKFPTLGLSLQAPRFASTIEKLEIISSLTGTVPESCCQLKYSWDCDPAMALSRTYQKDVLVVPPGLMMPQTTYLFTLNVSNTCNPLETAQASLAVVANTPPASTANTSLQVSSTTSGQVVLKAQGWQDSDLPLHYSFGWLFGDAYITALGPTQDPTATFGPPFQTQTAFITFFVRVTDAKSLSRVATVPVQLAAVSNKNLSQFVQQNFNASADVAVEITRLGTLLSEMNDEALIATLGRALRVAVVANTVEFAAVPAALNALCNTYAGPLSAETQALLLEIIDRTFQQSGNIQSSAIVSLNCLSRLFGKVQASSKASRSIATNPFESMQPTIDAIAGAWASQSSLTVQSVIFDGAAFRISFLPWVTGVNSTYVAANISLRFLQFDTGLSFFGALLTQYKNTSAHLASDVMAINFIDSSGASVPIADVDASLFHLVVTLGKPLQSGERAVLKTLIGGNWTSPDGLLSLGVAGQVVARSPTVGIFAAVLEASSGCVITPVAQVCDCTIPGGAVAAIIVLGVLVCLLVMLALSQPCRYWRGNTDDAPAAVASASKEPDAKPRVIAPPPNNKSPKFASEINSTTYQEPATSPNYSELSHTSQTQLLPQHTEVPLPPNSPSSIGFSPRTVELSPPPPPERASAPSPNLEQVDQLPVHRIFVQPPSTGSQTPPLEQRFPTPPPEGNWNDDSEADSMIGDTVAHIRPFPPTVSADVAVIENPRSELPKFTFQDLPEETVHEMTVMEKLIIRSRSHSSV